MLGITLFAAEKKKAKGVGFEIAPLIYLLAVARKLLARSKTKILMRNFLKTNLRKTNVIFCYLIPSMMPDLAGKIKKECSRGTRIISNTFHIPGLTPVRVYRKDAKTKMPTIYVYKI